MLTPQEVACQFIPAFFERLVSNPAELADMYAQQSSLVVVDFEYGTVEANGADIPRALDQLAQIFQGCEISVESYSAVPIYCGVNVCVSVFAESKTTRQCLEFVTVLEAYGTIAYNSDAYYIRNQFVFRPGAAEKEEPGVEVTPGLEEKVEVFPESEQSAATAAAEVVEAAAALTEQVCVEEQQQPPQSSLAKPRTWASLASGAPKTGEQRQSLKVTVSTNGTHNDTVKPPRAEQQRHASPSAASGAPKSFSKAARPPAVPIGDRLMFNIDHAVSDEDIKEALGSLASHIVSLRNNSANGHVFLDFSDKEKVLDALKANPPIVGARKTRVNIYRQRIRQ